MWDTSFSVSTRPFLLAFCFACPRALADMAKVILLLIDSWFRRTGVTQLARICLYGRSLRSRNNAFGRNLCYTTSAITGRRVSRHLSLHFRLVLTVL